MCVCVGVCARGVHQAGPNTYKCDIIKYFRRVYAGERKDANVIESIWRRNARQ